jgi:hypothetical protein
MEDRAYSRLEYHHSITRHIVGQIPARQAVVSFPFAFLAKARGWVGVSQVSHVPVTLF